MKVEEISEMLLSKVELASNASVKVSRIAVDKSKELRGKPVFSNSLPDVYKNIYDHRFERLPSVSKSLKTAKVVAIGTSTGRPSALLSVISSLPKNFPAPLFIVQHMPEGFTKAFAERLNANSEITVKEAQNGDKVCGGVGYLAPGDSHMLIERHVDGDYIKLLQTEKVSGHRPSIDVLFRSVNEIYGQNCIAVIMTGMGRDGSDGIMKIKKSGGTTIAQNEETSVVFGMNRVSIEIGAIKDVVALEEISKKIVEYL